MKHWTPILVAAALAMLLAPYAAWLFRPVPGCIRSDAWPWEVIALHVIADGLIAVAYVWIPVVLVFGIWTKLKARPEAKLLYLFGAFIVLCGLTHLDDAIAIWWPVYRFTGAVKLATGIVSIATAITLTRLAPQILSLGSQAADLQAARDEADTLRREAEARAIRAEGEVTELEQAHARIKEALARAEAGEARAKRAEQGALEHARIAEAARRQAEAAQDEKQAIQRAVKDLTTPVLPLTDRVLLTPLIGAVDSLRAAQWMDMTLEAVSESGADLVIVDLSGVPVVDTQVAASILKTAQAVELLGAKCIITGIRPAVAQTVVELGIDMSGVVVRGKLKEGLSAAMAMVKAA